MLGFGLWWLGRAEASARRTGEGFGNPKGPTAAVAAVESPVRERATTASEFDPAEIPHGVHAKAVPSYWITFIPLIVVILVNLAMSVFILLRLDTGFLAEERWDATSLSAVGDVWAVVVALASDRHPHRSQPITGCRRCELAWMLRLRARLRTDNAAFYSCWPKLS
jgi:hypothetical protein